MVIFANATRFGVNSLTFYGQTSPQRTENERLASACFGQIIVAVQTEVIRLVLPAQFRS